MSGGLTTVVGRWSLTEWVAVVATAPGPDELAEDVDALVDLCPDRVLLAPVDAHQGLAGALGVPADAWWCGVAAASRPELEEALGLIRASPRFGDRSLVIGSFRLLRLTD
ncbi:MAG: hypothetical protein ACRDKA_07985 [Actinomycetota bacterium]